jgi:hypothetical protein
MDVTGLHQEYLALENMMSDFRRRKNAIKKVLAAYEPADRSGSPVKTSEEDACVRHMSALDVIIVGAKVSFNVGRSAFSGEIQQVDKENREVTIVDDGGKQVVRSFDKIRALS